MSQIDILITIKPRHAKSIFDGNKKFELRKAQPKLLPRRIFLYETEGVKAVTGHIIISRVYSGQIDVIWENVKRGGIQKKSFFSYYDGYDIATAFEIKDYLKYKQPIPISEILKFNAGFKVPQNFLYLDNFPVLERKLKNHVFEEGICSSESQITFQNIRTRSVDQFKRLIDQHISGSYLETGNEYAEKLMEIHEQPQDAEGIFSENKHVIEVFNNSKLIGFAVLTEKLGGSVKTGPVILLKKHRNKKLGREMRKAFHQVCRRIGFRKVYCTVPSNNLPAIRYLIGSDYKIEAQLSRHYHVDHDELVFGHKLSNGAAEVGDYIRQIVPISQFEHVKNLDFELVSFLREEFEAAYCKVDDNWSENQIKFATLKRKGGLRLFKPREIFVAKSQALFACALCIIKRGGSAKLILLTQTGHVNGLTQFIKFVEKELLKSKNQKPRKFYTHIPLGDQDVISAFYANGYEAEGILTVPYRQTDDLIALGKIIGP